MLGRLALCALSSSGACVGSSGSKKAVSCCRCIETLPQPRTADEASSPLLGARPVIAIAPGNLLEPKSSSADDVPQGQSATGVNVLPLPQYGAASWVAWHSMQLLLMPQGSDMPAYARGLH